MPGQPTDLNEGKNKDAVRLALGAALGSALGIITAVRALSAARGQHQATIAPPETAERDAERRRAAEQIIPIGEARPADRLASPVLDLDHHPDWERLPPAHLPRPTYWPVVLALGVMFLMWGIVTTLAISVIGLLLLTLALGGWIGELRHGE
ncbi:MAG: hypothetical protein LC793_03900 [Thermomicrobia bacterium]|nr:hypothetical protein [Thermomicrobia bacterium]